MQINTINEFLALCHPRNSQLDRVSQEFLLVYLNIDIKCIKPVSQLLNIEHDIQPKYVKVAIVRSHSNEAYHMVAVILYDTRVRITSDEYFKIYNIVPYIVSNKLGYGRSTILNPIRRMITSCMIDEYLINPTTEIMNKQLIYTDRWGHNYLNSQHSHIEGEYENKFNIDDDIEYDYGIIDKVVSMISPDIRKLIDDRNKLDKSVENNDMNPRIGYNIDLITNHIDGTGNYPIIHGMLGLGKTSLAKYYTCYKCLIVEDLDRDLKKFDYRIHDSILFENIDFRGMDPLWVLNLICCPNRVIQCDDIKVLIPNRTELIFTTNIKNGMIFDHELKAVYSSCCMVPITCKTYTTS